MARQIVVRAKSDHLASLARTTPVIALSELIWNSLDADAHEVRVDVITNALGAVTAVRVSDDGTGIDSAHADEYFGALGGSWKRQEGAESASHRRLHGCHGCGRFKAFSLGANVEWRTTVAVDGVLRSYKISGSTDKIDTFELELQREAGPATGTEVFVNEAYVNCDTLLNAEETVQELAVRFALYLRAYPGVRIYFNGLPVSPLIVQKQSTSYKLHLKDGAEARLELVEWKRKFVGSGRLVLSGEDGFELRQLPAGVRAHGVPFTAYLISPRLAKLHAENALVMDELNPEVKMYLDEARKVLKAHFLANAEAPDPAFVREWTGRIAALSLRERKALLLLLRRSLRAK